MTTDARPSFLDRQKQAALDAITEQRAEFNRIADNVLPKRNDPYRRSRETVTDVIRLGDDHLAEVTEDGKTTWTFVVGGKASNWRHDTQESAILHLIASRYDDNQNSNINAAFYAGRVLGVQDN